MLTKIRKIRNLGIFSDYAWDATLQTFDRYNLIYGWNGSGKSTFASFIWGLASGTVPNCPNLEYEVETDSGEVLRNGTPLKTKIRVFNRDYVNNNVHTVTGKATPILILGEENKRIADEIAADEALRATKRAQLEKLETDIREATTQKNKAFSEIAKTIGLNTSGLAARNYRKPDAERDFAALLNKSLLTDDALAANALELKQQEKPDVPEVAIPQVSSGGEDKKNLEDFLSLLVKRGKALCLRSVESQIVERFRQHPEIGAWVEDGIALHKTHSSKTCEFCDQVLSPGRLGILTAHFNDADRKLKDDIEGLLKALTVAEQSIRDLRFPDKANLYDELQADYQSAADQFFVSRTQLLHQITQFRAFMEDKRTQTTDPITLTVNLDATGLRVNADAANAGIKRHNTKSKNFKAAKETARTLLETHYLSTIYDEVKSLEAKIARCELRIDKAKNGDAAIPGDLGEIALAERIRNNRARISSSHKGCEDINTALKTFLGREELQFEVEKDGYVLMRNRKIAGNLSEGERTAIGFVHFVTHLKDQGFDLTRGIVVIDDPVSSLDANSIFQAFSFLKTSIKDAKQVFVLTHNFDFLRLLVNWFNFLKKSGQKVGYYMIHNKYDASGGRSAGIGMLDKLLRQHESEYHYLFKRLYNFKDDGTLESVYHVPNIARKVLDTFLMFRVPNSDSSYAKMESLKAHFDEAKLTSIYKFTNHESHITGKGFDPSLVAETQKNVKYLLEMIATVFPEHYQILVKSVNS